MLQLISKSYSYLVPLAIHKVKVFLGREIRVLDRPDWNGDRALHFAVREGNILICEALLNARVNPNPRNFKGLTPLDIATNKQFDAIVHLLRSRGAR